MIRNWTAFESIPIHQFVEPEVINQTNSKYIFRGFNKTICAPVGSAQAPVGKQYTILHLRRIRDHRFSGRFSHFAICPPRTLQFLRIQLKPLPMAAIFVEFFYRLVVDVYDCALSECRRCLLRQLCVLLLSDEISAVVQSMRVKCVKKIKHFA